MATPSSSSNGAIAKTRAEITKVILTKKDDKGPVEVVLITPTEKKVIWKRDE